MNLEHRNKSNNMRRLKKIYNKELNIKKSKYQIY